MANENRLYFNLEGGVLSAQIDGTPATGSVTISSTQLTQLPTIDTNSHCLITIDQEIFQVTAHSVNATTATATRAAEGSAASIHLIGAAWVHGLVVSDLVPASYSVTGAASYSLPIQFGTWLVDASAGNVAITLTHPIISCKAHIKKIDNTANAVILTPPSGTIDGQATYAITNPYDSVTVASDGTNFFLV